MSTDRAWTDFLRIVCSTLRPRTVAVLLPCAAVFVGCGCDSMGGKPLAPTDRSIATPDKRIGQGGLPPAPQR